MKLVFILPLFTENWIDWKGIGTLSSLVNEKPSGGKGKSRLTDEVDAVIKAMIVDFHFNKEKKKRSKTERAEEVEERLRNAKLPIPHRNTIQNRIDQAEGERKANQSREAAKFDQPLSPAESLGADSPLAIVQIDHTPVDMMVVDDEHRLHCGKPRLTLAIDDECRSNCGRPWLTVGLSLDCRRRKE